MSKINEEAIRLMGKRWQPERCIPLQAAKWAIIGILVLIAVSIIPLGVAAGVVGR